MGSGIERERMEQMEIIIKKHFEFIEGLKVDLPSYRRDVLEE